MERPRLTKFRHTYATARLQTTDRGKQISLWTVAKELGHKNGVASGRHLWPSQPLSPKR